MSVWQVGLADMAGGVPYVVADMCASWTSMLGLALGILSFAMSICNRRSGRLIVYPALGAIGCLVMYLVWWVAMGAVPTGWLSLFATAGGVISGSWATWRYLTRPKRVRLKSEGPSRM